MFNKMTELQYKPACPKVRAQMELEFINQYGLPKAIENLDKFYRGQYSNYSDDNIRNFLFKIDSIHDFSGERGKALSNTELLQNLNWIFNDDNKKLVEKIILKNSDLETLVFLWLIQKVYATNERIQYVNFQSSIQNYLIDPAVQNSDFTIDASLKEYNIFETLLTSIDAVEIAKTRYIPLQIFMNTIEKLYEKIKNYFALTQDKDLRFILFCFAKNLSFCYKKFIEELDKPYTWTKLFQFYKDNENLKDNYNLKIKYYFQNNQIQTLPNSANDTDIDILNTYIAFVNSYTIKLPSKYKPPADIAIENLTLPENAKEKIQKLLFSGKDSTFKVIAPQKFDANRTTAGSGIDINEILHLNNCKGNELFVDTNKEQNCMFKILEDDCYFYTEVENNTTSFIFEIKDRGNIYWPISKVKIITNNKIFEETFTGKSIGENIGKPLRFNVNNTGAYIGLIKKSKKDKQYKFRYYPNTRILECTNAPGVSELIEIYKTFAVIKDNQTGLYSTNVSLDPKIVLTNILQIKRAGDYSQIWFCKKWNNYDKRKLFFMSNDKISASFCLLEGVPYIGQVSRYNFYFNPFGGKINAISTLQNMFRDLGYNISIPTLLKKNNTEILVNHDILCTDDNYDRKLFMYYLSFINYFKNYDTSQRTEIVTNFLKLQTDIITYQELSMNPDEVCPDATITERLKNVINLLSTYTESYISTKIRNDDLFYPLYEEIVELYYRGDKLYEKNFIDDIKNTLGLDFPAYYSYYQRRTDLISQEEGEEEAKNFLKERNIKSVVFPADADVLQYLKNLEDILPDKLDCNNLRDQISYLVSDYDLKYKTLLNTSLGDEDNIDWDKDDIYAENYNRLYNCLVPAYEQTNSEGKLVIKNILPEETFSSDLVGFSFENGLTYYQVNEKTPVNIPTTNFKNAKQTYIMDKNGLLSIQGSVKDGSIKLQTQETKTQLYKDGIEISYYKF